MSIRTTLARIKPKSKEACAIITAVVMMAVMLGCLSLGMFVARILPPEWMAVPMLGGVGLAAVAANGIWVWFDTHIDQYTDYKTSAGPRR